MYDCLLFIIPYRLCNYFIGFKENTCQLYIISDSKTFKCTVLKLFYTGDKIQFFPKINGYLVQSNNTCTCMRCFVNIINYSIDKIV